MNKKKRVIIIILIVMFLLASFIFLGLNFLTGGILFEAIFNRPSKPKQKTAEFPFTLVYEYNGEQFTVEESIVCEFEGISFSLEGGNSRDWNCYVTNNEEYGQYYLDREKYPTLYIQIPLNADYLMGAPNSNPAYINPYIFFTEDSTGTTYYEEAEIKSVGAKIISWKVAKPLVNNIKK